MATGFVYSPAYAKHMTGFDHPERPRRVSYVYEKLKENYLLDRLTIVEPRMPAFMWPMEVHQGRYLEHLRATTATAPAQLDTDTVICEDSFEVAMLTVGSALAACDEVIASRVRNAFCLSRPPGHHAESDHAMGFCLLNNVAIAARYLQLQHRLEKIFIVDWDVHHGNGTQDIFYDDPSVFYFSIHQAPFYPGTGAASETGTGKGLGTTLNVPLKAGRGDKEWLAACFDQLAPAIGRFKPDMILISAGFDAHWEDTMSQQRVSDEGFRQMSELLVNLADDGCQGRLVSILEGGYDIVSLSRSVDLHLRELLG